MEQLLPYFERELDILRHSCRDFASRYPQLAGNLRLAGDAASAAHIEHLIRAAALINARLAKRLDPGYPQFAEALFQGMYPQYLKLFPSCSIARFEPAAGPDAAVVPRGAALSSQPVDGVPCHFRTVYEVAPTSATLLRACFTPDLAAPAAVRLPSRVTAGISLAIGGLGALRDTAAAQAAAGPRPLRLFIDGAPALCAAVRDALFMRVASAHVAGPDGRWRPLGKAPLRAVGFADDEALIPSRPGDESACRLLAEYFAYPEKFNFVDIDVGALLPCLPPGADTLTLHLALSGLPAASAQARTLAALSADHLLPGCTPVVNLFAHDAAPIRIVRGAGQYRLAPAGAQPRAYEIYSVDAVRLPVDGEDGGAEFQPAWQQYGARQAAGKRGRAGYFWMLRDDCVAALRSAGGGRIAFIDADCRPAGVDGGMAAVALTCSNRDLPAALPWGAPDGDLRLDAVRFAGPIRLLRRPSAALRLAPGRSGDWRLISHLSLSHRSLTKEGLAAFTELLALYDLPCSAASQRQIAAVADIERWPATAWLRGRQGVRRAHGVELRMTLDETAFDSGGLHVFAQLAERLLGLYAHLNSFTQLVLVSQRNGEELWRGPRLWDSCAG